jgi:hypothetical protein
MTAFFIDTAVKISTVIKLSPLQAVEASAVEMLRISTLSI